MEEQVAAVKVEADYHQKKQNRSYEQSKLSRKHGSYSSVKKSVKNISDSSTKIYPEVE